MVLRLSRREARRLFLNAQGLSDNPATALDRQSLQHLIGRLGFVQLDSVKAVERAHHHILFTRNQRYRPEMLRHLLEERRTLFEHWTHDASVIPVDWYPHWHHRFRQFERRIRRNPRWREKLGGTRVIKAVRRRIEKDGPLEARDFAGESKGTGPWWGWSPHKAALEYLWFTGELAISGRAGFRKIYDLAERVLPHHTALPPTDREEHVDWACHTALQRLGFASPGEIAAFWDALSPDEAAAWCSREDGRAVQKVEVETTQGPKSCFAPLDIETRLANAPEPPGRIRLVSPFDPAIRDRRRTERLFDFSYRIEIFVPAAKRQYGYYVFPLLEGDRFIARADLKVDGRTGALIVLGFWPEPGTRWGKGRLAKLDAELERCAVFAGAREVIWTKGTRPGAPA
ncbi:MAG: winged helix-turn-helix domain-containing protein [Alphaproteobacteria bacterium]